jgi:membrane associated rhomboid family serine protease
MASLFRTQVPHVVGAYHRAAWCRSVLTGPRTSAFRSNVDGHHRHQSTTTLSRLAHGAPSQDGRRRRLFVGLGLCAVPLTAGALRDARTDDREAGDWGWGESSPADDSPPSPSPPPSSPRPALVPLRAVDDEIARAVEEAFGGRSSSPPPLLPHPPPHPPTHTTRLVPNEAAAAARATIYSLIGLNVGVWVAWQVPSASLQSTLRRWFMTSSVHLGGSPFPRGPASLLLSNYSHQSLLHLGANMLGLYSFGPAVMRGRDTQQSPILGPAAFLSLYTVSGVLSALASNLFSASLGSQRPSLGASGALFAVLTYHTFSRPDSGVLLFFVLEMTAATGLGFATAMNAWLVASEYRAARTGRPGPTFDGMAHLAGTAVGALWYYAARARARRRGAPPGKGPASGGWGSGGRLTPGPGQQAQASPSSSSQPPAGRLPSPGYRGNDGTSV